MSIIRGPRPESEFYILDKSISEDPRLGWGARAVLIYLLGKPDHWEVSIQHLINQTKSARRKSGRDQVYGFLDELSSAGYLTKQPKRKEGGAFAGYEYVVSELPRHPENPEAAPLTENPETAQPPLTDSPETVQPYTANPTQVSTDREVKTEGESKEQRDELVAKGFEIFYSAGLVKKSKQSALSAWKRIVKGRADPVKFARELETDIRTRIQYQQLGIDKLHPSTYLNGKRWEDEQIDERFLHAQKSPQALNGSHAGHTSTARTNSTMKSGESLNHESLHRKNYADGATADEEIPAYLRH